MAVLGQHYPHYARLVAQHVKLDAAGPYRFCLTTELLRRADRPVILMVTHDLDTLYSICDRVAVLVDKKIRVGTLEQLLQDNHPWIQSYFHGPRGRAALLSESPHSPKQEARLTAPL